MLRKVPGSCSRPFARLSALCGAPGKLAAAIAMNRRGNGGLLRNNQRKDGFWRDEPEGRFDGLRLIEEVALKKDSRGLQSSPAPERDCPHHAEPPRRPKNRF